MKTNQNESAQLLLNLYAQLNAMIAPRNAAQKSEFKLVLRVEQGIVAKNDHPMSNLQAIAFEPSVRANYGNISCYALIGEHSECCWEYATQHTMTLEQAFKDYPEQSERLAGQAKRIISILQSRLEDDEYLTLSKNRSLRAMRNNWSN